MELSVVVPAYREGPRIYDNLSRLLQELDELATTYEVIVVSDGNTDSTVSEVQRLASPRIRILEYPLNRGKGYALTLGVSNSTGRLVTFIDADMELHPRDIRNFIRVMEQQKLDVVVGSKRHPQSRVNYPRLRRVQSAAYQLLIRLLFRLNIRDTQTGLKLLRREVLMQVVPLLAVKRFAFDLELLVVAHHLGYRRIAEAPITLEYQFESTTNLRAAWRALWDTAAIFYRLRITRFYDRQRAVMLSAHPSPAGVAVTQAVDQPPSQS